MLKGFIRDYKDGDEKAYAAVVDMISVYIYNYPRVVFGADPDRCGDFYEYIFVRLRDIIKQYNDTGAKFVTWFTVVLRNRYFNYIRESRKEYILREGVDLLSLDYESGRFSGLYSLVGDKRDYNCCSCLAYERLVDTIVRNLNDRQRALFHLYYVETLRPEDVGFLSIYLGRPPKAVLEGIDEIRNSIIRRYELQKELLIKLNTVYYRIVRCEERGDERKAGELREKRQKLISEYRNLKINPPYRSISGFLKLPLGTVSTGIMRMKSRVQSMTEIERAYRGLQP